MAYRKLGVDNKHRRSMLANLTKDLIIKTVENLIENKPKLQKMENAAKNSAIIDANERIYEVLMQLYTKA